MKQGDAVLHPRFLLEVALERHFATVLYGSVLGSAGRGLGAQSPAGFGPTAAVFSFTAPLREMA